MKNSEVMTYASVIKDVRNNIITVNEETLERIKTRFSHVINSTRSMFYIKTLKDLVFILELRAIDGRDRDDFSASLVECEKSSKAEKSHQTEGQEGTGGRPSEEQEIPRHVLDMVASQIGRKWWDVAHSLDIPEWTIEEIEGKHPYSVKQQAYQALLTFCNQPDCDEKGQKLLDALANSRRYDLMSKVEKELGKKKQHK